MDPRCAEDVERLRDIVQLGMHSRPPGYTNPIFTLRTAFLASLLAVIDDQTKEIDELRDRIKQSAPVVLPAAMNRPFEPDSGG